MSGEDVTDAGADDAESPYTLQREEGGEEHHAFWADEVADRIEERVVDQREATERASGEDGPASREPEEPIVIKGGISPSGVPHLGNVNEIMRGYYVAEVLRERGHEVRQVFTADDRDPLRKLPRTLCDLEGELVDLGDVNAGALGRNLGSPYTDIPDPFGCCDSYGEHFSNIIADSAEAVDVPIELVSNTDLYEDGEFEELTRFVLENQDTAPSKRGRYARVLIVRMSWCFLLGYSTTSYFKRFPAKNPRVWARTNLRIKRTHLPLARISLESYGTACSHRRTGRFPVARYGVIATAHDTELSDRRYRRSTSTRLVVCSRFGLLESIVPDNLQFLEWQNPVRHRRW